MPSRTEMKLLSLLLLVQVSLSHANVKYNYNEVSEILIAQNGRISGIKSQNGEDIMIGGLIYVHENINGRCDTEKIDQRSNENLEAMLYAIDTINSDLTLLPNITLGYDIRDTCGSESVGLDEAINMIYSTNSETKSCNETDSRDIPVSAVIGAIISPVSISAAGLFRYFKMPQVSFTSTSSLLSNREFYPYFFRTIPPDDHQVQALVDLILHFKWNHISTLYSSNRYGQPAINAFHKLANQERICLDISESLDDHFTPQEYDKVAMKLYNSEASVVVLFASLHNVKGILDAVLRVNETKRQFLWLASDSWSEFNDDKYSDITIGKWGTAPSSPHVLSFNDYYSQLTPTTNERNPWFNELYQYYYNCSNGGGCSKSITNSPIYTHNSFNGLAIDAVYSIASALDEFFKENCETPLVWHPQNRSCLKNNNYNSLTGEKLKNYIQTINITSLTNNTINFDNEGNVEGEYKIINYQRVTSPDCDEDCKRLVTVGTWEGNQLKLYNNVKQQFGIDIATSEVLTSVLQSNCQECPPGHIKRPVTSSCCGTCDPCLGSSYTNTNSSTSCMRCPANMWGNNPLSGSTHCIDINESYLKPSDPWGIVLILLAVIGLLAVVFVTSVFIWFWNTPIVKSSGREQMILVLIGLTLCFVITVFFLLKPSPVSCGFRNTGIWVSYSLVLCALFVKLVRIARIFAQKKTTSRPRFIAPHYQVGFTFLLIIIPLLLIIISLIATTPQVDSKMEYTEPDHNSYPKLIITCSSPHTAVIVLLMMYFSALLIASNALAVVTIRFPENFNEAKFVSFATFSLVLTWFFFILAYIISRDTPYQGAALSTTVQVSAMAILVCLFGPRVFIMVFWPSKNVKEKSTTVSGVLPLSKRNSSFIMQSDNNDDNKT